MQGASCNVAYNITKLEAALKVHILKVGQLYRVPYFHNLQGFCTVWNWKVSKLAKVPPNNERSTSNNKKYTDARNG